MSDSIKPVQPKSFSVKPSLGETKKLVKELMAFIDQNKLAVNIAGKRYLQVEAWQFVGSQLNLTAIVTDIEDVSLLEPKYIPQFKATVEVIHNPTGQLVSKGFAYCSKAESKKSSFDAYAVASMAQTRAIGKAYRNILAWLVKMAGFEGTPAEEINRKAMQEDLSKIKSDVFAAFKAAGIADSQQMIVMIRIATGKETIENSDDAMAVLAEISKKDEVQS